MNLSLNIFDTNNILRDVNTNTSGGIDHSQRLSAHNTPKPAIIYGFRSALIPGWGELAQGNNSGYLFLSAEVALWASRFYFDSQSDLKIRQSKQFAINNGNLKNFNISEDIWVLMERFDRSGFEVGGYHASVLNNAIALYPNCSVAQTEYILMRMLDSDVAWDWGDRDTRRQYQIMRKDSKHYTDFVLAVSGVILANHITSFFNAMRISNRDRRVRMYANFDNELNPNAGINISF
jgi:hypothetical protein